MLSGDLCLGKRKKETNKETNKHFVSFNYCYCLAVVVVAVFKAQFYN